MKGTIAALIITTGRIIALYQYLMSPLSFLSPLTEVSTWTHRAGSLPTASVSPDPPALCLLPSSNFFSLGMSGAEAAEELVTYLRTACKSSFDLPNQFLK